MEGSGGSFAIKLFFVHLSIHTVASRALYSLNDKNDDIVPMTHRNGLKSSRTRSDFVDVGKRVQRDIITTPLVTFVTTITSHKKSTDIQASTSFVNDTLTNSPSPTFNVRSFAQHSTISPAAPSVVNSLTSSFGDTPSIKSIAFKTFTSTVDETLSPPSITVTSRSASSSASFTKPEVSTPVTTSIHSAITSMIPELSSTFTRSPSLTTSSIKPASSSFHKSAVSAITSSSVDDTSSSIRSTVSKVLTTNIKDVSSLITPTVSVSSSSSVFSSTYSLTSTITMSSATPYPTSTTTFPTAKPTSGSRKTSTKKKEARKPSGRRSVLVFIIILLLLVLLFLLYLIFLHNNAGFRKQLRSMLNRFNETGRRIRGSLRPGARTEGHPATFELPYTPVTIPIPVGNYPDYVENLSRNEDHLLKEEFKVIQNLSEVHAYTTDGFSHPDNQPKNRYGNIKAYDHSRVRLQSAEGKPGSDYINANFIDGYEQEECYIATQGPLESTCGDFWRMCWEKNVPTIIMLTRTIEKEKLKCQQYWPEQGSITHDGMTITLLQNNILPNHEERTFKLEHQDFPEEERFINHLFFVSWPDHGTPCPHQLLMFVKRVNQISISEPSPTAPILIHCSAGVGRTGTYIVVDVNMRRIASENNIDIYSYLRRIRGQRNYMVQTVTQYIFLHQCLLQYLQTSSMEIQVQQFRDRVKHLQEANADGSLNVEDEFRTLQNFDQSNKVRTMEIANASVNRNKNRFLNILPYDESRVVLGVGQPTNVPDIANYINASYVHGYSARYQFVATQAPLPQTHATFWKMVLERFCPIIVCLSDKEDIENNKMDRYWPVAETVMYEQMMVDCISDEGQGPDLSVRQLRVKDMGDGQTRVVKHFHYIGGVDNNCTKDAEGMIKLVGNVQQSYQENPTGNIIVHCTSGVGRTGVFIGLHNSIEQVRIENIIDVFHTVMELRYQRPSMVQTAEQYMFLYFALHHYLDSFDIYENAI